VRFSGAFMIAVLVAAGYVLYLSGRDAGSSLDAVATMADGLREEGASARPFDPTAAASMAAALEALLAAPETIDDRLADLRLFAETAGSWAAAAPSASRELHVAVLLRSAAGELRAHALDPSASHLDRARFKLEAARATLAGAAAGDPDPRLATDGVRDQLENLQQSAQERQLEVDEALKR
jgi:hypothetical protein